MWDYFEAGLYGVAMGGAVMSPLLVKIFYDEVRTGVKARQALAMISGGKDPSEYRWDLEDLNIQLGLAGLIAGGKKAVERAMERSPRFSKHIKDDYIHLNLLNS